MELDPEVHAHAPKVGHRAIDLALTLSVLALSVGSIIIAIQNEANMQRLVTANSWPYIETIHGNEKNGQAIIHFDVRNAGIGPATLEKLVVRYNGQTVRSGRELLQRCCAIGGSLDAIRRVSINMVENRVLPAREEITFLAVSKSDVSTDMWERLDVERLKVDMDACYSSVFGEHWTTSLRNPRPVRVKSCDALPGSAYEGNLADVSP
jgi:hypothetical protein